MNESQPEDVAAVEVPFSKIAESMAQRVCRATNATPMRALVATVVAIGPAERSAGAAAALRILGDAGTVRGILISEGDNPEPPARVAGNTVALHGLVARYINNAVAALRLSSLPTTLWWRGRRTDLLDGLARWRSEVVSTRESEPIWERASRLFDDGVQRHAVGAPRGSAS